MDVAQKYAFDFNDLSPPEKHLLLSACLLWQEKDFYRRNIISGPKIQNKRIQFFQVAFLHTTVPVQRGSITGSVKEIVFSQDFVNTFKAKFGLKYLGLWRSALKAENDGAYTYKKIAVHYEIECQDLNKDDEIIIFFNRNASKVDSNFFGTQMIIASVYTSFFDKEIKLKINRHARKQLFICDGIKCVTITGITVLNWADSQKQNTLDRQLILVESIHTKTLVKSSGKVEFKGRLVYTIIPNQKAKYASFYYSNANSDEARSVARGICLFIRNMLKIKSSLSCSFELIVSALEVEWDANTRLFLTAEKKCEKDKFSFLEDIITASIPAFISKDHQGTLAAEGDDVGFLIPILLKATKHPSRLMEKIVTCQRLQETQPSLRL